MSAPSANLLVLFAVLAGTMIAAQGVVNGRMAVYIGGPIQAALISFSVGWIALLAVNLALGHSIPVISTVQTAPWWAWAGGLMGAIVVALAATAVPRIGVATYVAAFIAGQMTAAVVYDHFGIMGQAVREVTPMRLLGVVFLGLGVYLIRRF